MSLIECQGCGKKIGIHCKMCADCAIDARLIIEREKQIQRLEAKNKIYEVSALIIKLHDPKAFNSLQEQLQSIDKELERES